MDSYPGDGNARFHREGRVVWLKWLKSIDPSTQHANYEKNCADVAAKAAATTPPTVEGGMAASVEEEDGVEGELYNEGPLMKRDSNSARPHSQPAHRYCRSLSSSFCRARVPQLGTNLLPAQ